MQELFGQIPDRAPRLVSYDPDMQHCTLAFQGREFYFDLTARTEDDNPNPGPDARFALVPISILLQWRATLRDRHAAETEQPGMAKMFADMLAYMTAPSVDEKPLEWPPLLPLVIDTRVPRGWLLVHTRLGTEAIVPDNMLGDREREVFHEAGYRIMPLYLPQEPQS